MKYKIEIWQWHALSKTYESNNIKDVVEWYKLHWKDCYEQGYCTFCVYENDRQLSFSEEDNLGFF